MERGEVRRVETLGKYYLGQVIRVNMNSDKSP